jgi:hypothetical protein
MEPALDLSGVPLFEFAMDSGPLPGSGVSVPQKPNPAVARFV